MRLIGYRARGMRGLSLRAKVFFLFAGAALVIVVPALLFVANAVERNAYARATDDLQKAAGTLGSSWTVRGDVLAKAAQLKAADTRVLEAWDPARPRQLARALRTDVEKDVVLAADTAFRPLVGPAVDRATLAAAVGAEAVVVLPDTGAPLRLAVVKVALDTLRLRGPGDTLPGLPGRDTVPLGYLGVGSRISAVAIQKELGTSGDVVLVAGDSLVRSTLGTPALAAALAEIRRRAPGQQGTIRFSAGDDAYLGRAFGLPGGSVPVTVVLFRKVTAELRIVTGIQQSLFLIGAFALLLALLLAAVVARIVSRPAQALADASARLAQGDYSAPIPRDSGDEIGQLARVFGEMRAAIFDREQRLRSAQAEMIHREKLAAMGRLVAQLSHEINNPIYNIQNCLEALERRGNPTDPNREFLTLAQEELSRMATLTRQLLDQSRPLSDAAQPVSLNALVQRVLTLAQPELQGRGIEAHVTLAPGLPQVVVHPEGIQQVLANLVNNALDAMPAGGTLRLTTRADDDAVEVVVEDTGTGIAEQDLPHIFEAFYTTKPGVAGIGLGLFVSEGIIRGHRGRLSVESRRGEGSRFTVRLPRETLDERLSQAPLEDSAVAVG